MRPDLTALSAPALSAAMRGGTAEWGEYASAFDHVRYAHQLTEQDWPKRKRRMCRCGCRKKVIFTVVSQFEFLIL